MEEENANEDIWMIPMIVNKRSYITIEYLEEKIGMAIDS